MFFGYFLNIKKVTPSADFVISPATAGGLPLFPHAASTFTPAGATTGQRGSAAGEMEPNGDKRRGFAVGAPARRSRDGNGKIAAPVGPMTGQRGFAAGEMRLNGSKGRRRSVRLKKPNEYELYSLY